jgi:hypothetical protein
MEQGSSASALAARTAGMTDEQILDLDLSEISGENAPPSSAPLDDMGILDATSFDSQGAVMSTAPARLENSNSAGLGAATSAQSRSSAPVAPNPKRHGEPFAKDAQGEPAWVKELEAQPAAAAEARQWREAAQNVAALDAAYFSGDAGARSALAARLYESDPGAFREMLAQSARVLASRDPQGLAELARQLGMNDTQAPNAQAKSLAHAARPSEAGTTALGQTPADPRGERGGGAFPAEAYRAFESATNDDVAKSTRESIERTLTSTLPDGIGEGARRRIADDIFNELHATLSADRELSRQVGEILRGWHFDGATRQQVVSLISARARGAMPEVARRVVSEWTSSVLASDRARAARVDAAASRRDITGGRVPDTIPTTGLLPRKIDYSRMSDEQILDL